MDQAQAGLSELSNFYSFRHSKDQKMEKVSSSVSFKIFSRQAASHCNLNIYRALKSHKY